MIYIHIISLCEQSSSVWHSSITLQNEDDLEQIQGVAITIILKNCYTNYQNALNILELQSLKERREEICLKFAQKCLSNPKKWIISSKLSKTQHKHFQISFSNTERLRKSPIIYMQTLLNKEIEGKINLDIFWNALVSSSALYSVTNLCVPCAVYPLYHWY